MSTTVRDLQAKKAATVEAARALMTVAEAANRDFNDEEKAQYDAMSATIQSLNARIDRAQAQELAEAGLAPAAPAARSVEIPAAARIAVSENIEKDPKRGFFSFGDYAKSVAAAGLSPKTGNAIDKRLLIGAVAPATYGNEASGSDGAFVIPPGFSTDIFTLTLDDSALLPMTDKMDIDGNSMVIPKDETTPWGTNGVRAYWQAEAGAGTPTKPVFGAMELRLKKLMALVAVSDEIIADTNALNSYLPKKVAASIQWKTNEAILFGSGVGLPFGALNSGAMVTVVKDTSQATGTLSATNLANMISRLPPGSFPKSVWLINSNVLPALFTMTLGNYPIYLPAGSSVGGLVASPYGNLLGRPVMVSQHAKSFSSQGDVILVDLSYYQSITKAQGMETATSMHLYFDADAMAFRTTFRMDGQSKIVAPISPANGSTTLSPFVQLGAR